MSQAKSQNSNQLVHVEDMKIKKQNWYCIASKLVIPSIVVQFLSARQNCYHYSKL